MKIVFRNKILKLQNYFYIYTLHKMEVLPYIAQDSSRYFPGPKEAFFFMHKKAMEGRDHEM